MNAVEISCPSKTFIIGEYAVLNEASAILLNTKPRFSCLIKQGVKDSILSSREDLLQDSSGKIFSNIDIFQNKYIKEWIKKYSIGSQKCLLEWSDPHNGRGGFGFSTAQFNILYAYSCYLKDISIEKVKSKEVWRTYRGMDFEGCPPSGADLIAQWADGLCVFKQKPLSVESYMAVFPSLDYFILRTGEKLDTYKYLKEFQKPETYDLEKIVTDAVVALETRNENQFIESVNEYRKVLLKKNLVTNTTKNILEKISTIKNIKAYKGCGAMGAETVILFFDTEHKEEIKQELLDFEIIADKEQITYGVEYHKVTKMKEAHH